MKVSALPPNMQNKIGIEISPVSGLPEFCWGWTGALNSRGYGCIAVNGKSQLSHRRAYELLVGPIPTGLQIDHLCGNKRCCNPSHLEPVTAATNIRRSDRVNKTLCIRGHRLQGHNLIVKRAGNYTIRNCRECFNTSIRRSYHAAKAAS